MATHVLQLLKMVQLKYGVTMICKFFFWSFHMIYIVYLLSVIWTFFLWSQGVILLISTNWFWYWKLWISPAHYEIIFCQNIILLNVNYTSLICAFLLLLWWKESLNNSAVIGESHVQFAHLQLKWRIILTVWRTVRHTVFLSQVLVLLLQMFSPVMEHYQKFFIRNISTNGND